ncbi:MAG: hypothetical protein WCH83_08535 [Alphaproteobacteria bacterium]
MLVHSDRNAMYRFILRPLIMLLATFVLVETWIWDRVGPVLTRIVRLLPFEALKQRIHDAVTSLPPYPTLGVFIIPVLLLLPVKLAVLGLLATGHVILGGVVFIIAKVVGVGIGAFLFETCKPKLLQIPLFARFYAAWTRWVVWAHALIDPIKRRIRARIRLMTRHRPSKTFRILRLVQRIRRVRARPA